MIQKTVLLYFMLFYVLRMNAQQVSPFPIYTTSLELSKEIKAYRAIKKPTKEEQLKMYTLLGDFLLKTNQLTVIETTKDVQEAFKDNTFILEALDHRNFWDFGEPISISVGKIETSAHGNKSIFSKVGNFNATIYADAFAKVIVKRFKQDMNALFFINMKTEMDKSIELKTLFPNTYGGLSLMNNDIYVFNQYIEGLRQKMEEDLANIFPNTTELLETEKYTQIFKGNQSARGFLTTVTQFADGLIQNQHPGHIIENLHFSDAFDKGEGQDLKAGLQIIQLISAGFRSNNVADSTHYWVHGLDSLNLLFKGDALAANVWIGSLHQLAVDEKGVPITFQNGETLRNYINGLYNKKDNFFTMRNYVQGLIKRVNTIEMSVKDMQKAEGGEGKLYWDKMVSSYQNILSLVKFAPTIKDLLQPQSAMPRTWYRGIYVAETLSLIYAEMKGREYHAAIQHIANLVQAVDSRPMYVKKGDKYVQIDTFKAFFQRNMVKQMLPMREYKPFSGTYFMDNEKPVLINKIYFDSLGKREVDYRGLKKFVKYSSFAASMVLARTSEEVADLLESTMTTSGGTYVKESGWLLSVNSYLGLQKTFKQNDTLGFFSISAPIGLNLSYGFKRKPRYTLSEMQQVGSFIAPHTIQIFASLIDVGAIAGFRFSNDTTVRIPKVKLSNIFSPGVFIQFGRIFNSPLNIGFGYQAQPRLYAIKEDSILLKQFQFRFNANVSWDVPFWHLKHWGSN